VKSLLLAAALVIVLTSRCGAEAEPGAACTTDDDCGRLQCDVGECRRSGSPRPRPSTRSAPIAPRLESPTLSERFRVALGARITADPVLLPDGNVLVIALDGRAIVLHADGTIAREARLGFEVRGTPAVDITGRIAVGGYDGVVRFLDSELREVARVDVRSPIEGRIAVLSSGLFAVPARGLHLVTSLAAVVARVPTATPIRGGAVQHRHGLVLFATTEGELVAADVRGHERFRVRIGANADAPPAVLGDGSILVGTDLAELVRVDESGTILGRSTAALDFRGSAVVRPDGTVLAASLDGMVHTYDASMVETSTFALPHGVVATPALAADGSILVGTLGGTLHVLDAHSVPVSEVSIGSPIVTTPLLLRTGTVLVASDDGFVRGFR